MARNSVSRHFFWRATLILLILICFLWNGLVVSRQLYIISNKFLAFPALFSVYLRLRQGCAELGPARQFARSGNGLRLEQRADCRGCAQGLRRTTLPSAGVNRRPAAHAGIHAARRVHIISLRKANDREIQQYEEAKTQP